MLTITSVALHPNKFNVLFDIEISNHLRAPAAIDRRHCSHTDGVGNTAETSSCRAIKSSCVISSSGSVERRVAEWPGLVSEALSY
jgi:hypothetical protein